MSAKRSLNYSHWVRQEVASLPSPNRGKTLKPRSEKPEYSWKRLYSKRLDKVIKTRKAGKRMRRKRPGCNVNEHRGSLVKIENRDNLRVVKMDETLFYERSQHH